MGSHVRWAEMMRILLWFSCFAAFAGSIRGDPDFGECSNVITQWLKEPWGPTEEGHILIKAKGDPTLEGWEATVELDQPVTQCVDFNAQMTKISDSIYKFGPKPWNRVVPEGTELQLKLHITWERDVTSVPSPASLEINGQFYNCSGSSPSSTIGPSTKSSPFTTTTIYSKSTTSAGPSTTSNQETSTTQTTKGVPTTTTQKPLTTSSGSTPAPSNGRGIFASWPNKVLGLYVILADDYHDDFKTDTDWSPKLYEYQQTGANVLFLTFINAETMKVPKSFQNLAATRGKTEEGSVPKDTVIIFAIGGAAYSTKINPWPWLTSKEAAEEMAAEVATWPEKYGCDGIDMDIEDGAGNAKRAGENMVHFVRKLRELSPRIIVSQPTYGYPSIGAEITGINESWDAESNSYDLEDSIGIMVYEGTQSLNSVKNFVNGADQWQGFPITCRAPTNTIIVGAKGTAGSKTLNALADSCIENDYRGVMVWYASVPNGLVYGAGWDASDPAYQQSFIDTMNKFKPYNN